MAEENARWKIFVGVPDEEAESIAQEYPDFKKPIKQVYNYKGSKPTEEAVYNSMPWAADRGYKVMIQPDMETKADRALQSFEAFATAVPDTMTLGLTGLARRAAFGAMQDKPFLEGMKDVREYDKYLEQEHPWATGMGILGGIGASAALGSPLGAIGGAGKLASRAPAVLRPAVKGAGFVARGAAPGAIYKTADVLSEGRVPTAGEELGAGGVSLATDIALRGAGKIVSKIPGVKKLSSSIDRKFYGEDAFPAARATRGAQEVRDTMGFSKDAAGFKQELMAHTPYNSAANRDPIYLSTDPRIQTAMISVAASGNTKARDALRKDINRRLEANDKALREQLAKTTGSDTGLGSPTFTAVNKQVQLAEDKGLRKFTEIKAGVEQPMLPVRTGSKGEKAAVDDYLLTYLRKEDEAGRLVNGAKVDFEAGTANPAALRHATRNITANNVAENAEANKLAQISAARTLDKEFKRVNPGSTASFEKSILRNRRISRLEEEFDKAAELPTSKKASYLFDIGKTKDEIDLLSKVYGEGVAKNAQKEVVQARKAGLLSGVRESLYNEVPEEGVRYKLPIDNPRVRSAIMSDNPELYREMQLHNMLVEARSIMNDPSLSAAKGSRAFKKSMASHGIRAAASVTGSYGTQQGLLTLLDAAILLSKKSRARAVSSFLQKPINQLSTLLGATPLPKSVIGKYFDTAAPLLGYLSSKYATPENIKRKKKEE